MFLHLETNPTSTAAMTAKMPLLFILSPFDFIPVVVIVSHIFPDRQAGIVQAPFEMSCLRLWWIKSFFHYSLPLVLSPIYFPCIV
jgi:hypothetical protein